MAGDIECAHSAQMKISTISPKSPCQSCDFLKYQHLGRFIKGAELTTNIWAVFLLILNESRSNDSANAGTVGVRYGQRQLTKEMRVRTRNTLPSRLLFPL